MITVTGFKPADALWPKMKAVKESCKAAGVEVPKAVSEYFLGQEPLNNDGVSVDLQQWVGDWFEAGEKGYEIDLSKLPKEIKIIRIYAKEDKIDK